MDSRFRNVFKVMLAAAALGTGSLALAAGIAGRMADQAREQRQEQRSEQRSEGRSGNDRSESRSQRSEQPARSERPARSEPARQQQPVRQPQPVRQQQPVRQDQPARQAQPSRQQSERSGGSSSGVLGDLLRSRESDTSRARQASPPPAQQPAPVVSPPRTGTAAGVAQRAPQRVETAPAAGGNRQGGARGNDREAGDRDNDRGVLGTLAREQARERDRNDRDWDRDTNPDRDRDDRRDAWRDRDGDRDRHRRTVHVVHHLPYGYRDYLWNGGRYYYHDGYWYRPYGTSFITVGIPYGLFVTTLPGAYTSVWIGGTRYYYSDYHYYVYEPARRGYVVVRSPYGDDYVYEDDQDYVDSRLDDDLYIYPAEGQSEQQQADDRYECHRWAVSQTGYDPIDDEYDADLREDYLRAITACLTGRGYTVR
jgi:hypothetical protein